MNEVDIRRVEALRVKGKLIRTNPDNDRSPRYRRLPWSVRQISGAGGMSAVKYNSMVAGLSEPTVEEIDSMMKYMGYIRLVFGIGGNTRSFMVMDIDKIISDL